LALAAACAKVDMPAGTVSSSDGGGGTGGFVLDAGRDLTSSIDGIGAVQPPVPPAGNGGGPCENLCKRQMACAGGGDTTISGVVHAPTPPALGTADPLYNALVYVPNAPVTKFTPGVACERCAPVSGAPLVKTLTGPDGKFTLRKCPSAGARPLAVRVWRGRCVQLTSAVASSTTGAAASRAAFHATGSMAGTSRRRRPRASRGRMSARYSTGFTSASRQQPRIV